MSMILPGAARGNSSMRALGLASLGAAFLASGSALAGAAPVDWNLSLGTGYGWIHVPPANWSVQPFTAEGHIGTIVGNFGVAADAWGETVKYKYPGGITSSAEVGGLGIHANRRWADGLFGGLVSLGISPNGYNATMLNTALEGQQDFGPVTLGAQAGYTQTVGGGTANFTLQDPKALYAHGIARWFINDRLMLAGDIGATSFSDSTGVDGHSLRWGARLEYKPASLPVSLSLSYMGFGWHQPGYDESTNILLVGLTFLDSKESLAQRYRGPAGLDDLNPLYGVNFPP